GHVECGLRTGGLWDLGLGLVLDWRDLAIRSTEEWRQCTLAHTPLPSIDPCNCRRRAQLVVRSGTWLDSVPKQQRILGDRILDSALNTVYLSTNHSCLYPRTHFPPGPLGPTSTYRSVQDRSVLCSVPWETFMMPTRCTKRPGGRKKLPSSPLDLFTIHHCRS